MDTFFTHFSRRYYSTQYNFMSYPPAPARPVLMVITPGKVWRASIHSDKAAVGFRDILKSLLWSLVIFVDAVTPCVCVCSSAKYFLGVTHVPTVRRESLQGLICPLLLMRCSGVCLHDTLHISNKKRKKKMEKRRACLNNGRKRYAALHRVAGREREGMRNVKQMSWSSALPEKAELRHPLIDWETITRLDFCLHLKAAQFCTYLHVCPRVCAIWIYMHRC